MALKPIKKASVPLPPSRLSFRFQRTATHQHQGIDLVAPLGTPVYAAESGIVDQVAYEYRKGFSGYGRIVVVAGKSGRWFLYAHLDDILVSEGQNVLEGQKIATVGRTAFTKDEPEKLMSGAHLHFEVSPTPYPQHSESTRLDPIAFLSEKKSPLPYQQSPQIPLPVPSQSQQKNAVATTIFAALSSMILAWAAFRNRN